jgi:hypothetical protein
VADEAKKPDLYVFSVDAVRKSIDSLLKNKTHEHVPGYLALLRSQKKRAGNPSALSDIVDLHDRYLKVLNLEDHPPYLRPFVSRGRNVWFNDNVSGSYAPSNVKADPGPFFRVVDIAGSGLNTTYSLPVDHAARASEHLLRGHKLPVTALAAFIYRDYGFDLDTPSVASVVSIFRDEFCVRASESGEAAVFDTLFYDDAADFAAGDLELLQG